MASTGIHHLRMANTKDIVMGARRIFSRGGQIRGLGTKVPQRGPGVEPRWRSGG